MASPPSRSKKAAQRIASSPDIAESLFSQDRHQLARALRDQLDPEDSLSREQIWLLVADERMQRDVDRAFLEAAADRRAETVEGRRRQIAHMGVVVKKMVAQKNGKLGGARRKAMAEARPAVSIKQAGRPKKDDELLSDRSLRRRKKTDKTEPKA